MEALIILLLLAILTVPIILLIWFKVSTSSLIREAIHKINSLNVKVDKLQEEKVLPKVVSKEEDKAIDERVERLLDVLPKKEEKEEEKIVEEVKPVPQIVKPIKPKETAPKVAALIKPKKKRDLEKFVGENLLNKIGIGVLVLGIAYFVKYAIDNNWINEVGRVAIGILSGGLLTFLAHKIRKTYKAFSSVLVGGAMAVFYYTISIGFHDYQLFSQPVAFTLMVVITAFSVVLAIGYDKKELAILALVGAFSTPLMLSTGSGDYRILFTYITIVNVGMLVLAYFKKWNVVNIVALSFTVLLYGAWFGTKIVGGINPPYYGALVFASIFYLTFFFMHIVHNVKEKRKFKGYEFGLLLGTTALYYGIAMAILNLSGNTQFQGLFTVVLGTFNLLFAYPLYKRNNVDKSLIFLLVGMVLSFVSLAAPVQLSGNYITLFWVTEMVLLLWLGQKSKIPFIKLSSVAIFVLAQISLLMDWEQIYFAYNEANLALVFNKGFVTTAFSLIGSIAYLKLLSKEESVFVKGLSTQLVKNFTKISIAALAYFIGVLEIGYQVDAKLSHSGLAVMSVFAYTLVYIKGVMEILKTKGSISLQRITVLVAFITICIYPIFNMFEQVIRNYVLYGKLQSPSLLVNYLNLAMVAVISVGLIKSIKKWYGFDSVVFKSSVWVLSLIGLIVLSAHLHHQLVTLFFDAQLDNMSLINKQVVKIGYPILWGLSSFVLMLVGMKYKFRTLRIVSLSIFSIVLLKLFMFDIKGASEAGKIVAFILLGVLMLVISFMYQKLKNLILDDTQKTK
jgi:uncharacterized membrane protein